MKITSKTINYTVETVEELSTIVGQENDVIVVTDENRGGTFVYRSAEAGTNNSGTIFNGWVRQYAGAVNVKWFGAKGDGATDDTLAIYNAINISKNVMLDSSTYRVELNIDIDNSIINFYNTVLKLYSNGSLSNGSHSTLKLSGDNIIVNGDFTVDGYGDIEDFTWSGKDGNITFTGNNITVNGDIYTTKSRGYGISVWNGVNETSGTSPTNLKLQKIVCENNVLYNALIWDVDGFSINEIVGISGTLSTDSRIRTGTQSSSNLQCKNGYIGKIKGTSTIETNTRNVHFEELSGVNHKIEDCWNITVDKIYITNSNTDVAYAFSLHSEFPSIGIKDISIGDIYIEGCYSTVTDRALSINAVDGCNIRKLHIKNCSYTNDIKIRDGSNIYIEQCILENSGTAARGLLEENGYTRKNIVINNLVSTGHTINDVEQNTGAIKINTINKDAVRLYYVAQKQKENIIKPITLTVGTGGDFANLHQAIQYVTENYNSVYFGSSGFYINPIVTIQLLTGYVWDNAITLNGINLGFVEITTQTSVISNYVTNIKGVNGSVLPVISGTYDKNGSGGVFINVSNNAVGRFNGTLTNFINVPFRSQSGAILTLTSSSSTKHPSATDNATVTKAELGGTIVCTSATTTKLEVYGGGTIYASDSINNGGTSQAVNTITASGIIFK